ncbi:MAG: hypothetical protein J5697_03145 [Clostridia bacterium]|nr:hypothetical protein [Clostridia bacterium]
MRTKKLKTVLIVILSFFMIVSASVFGFLSGKPAYAEEFILDLFECDGTDLQTAYNSDGLKAYTTTEGGSFGFKNSISGRFSVTFSLLSADVGSNVKMVIKDVNTLDTLELNLAYSETEVNASVRHNDDIAGIYYGGYGFDAYNQGVKGRTKIANAEGVYTIRRVGDDQTVDFDPDSYSFYIDGTLIWSFAAGENDGKETEKFTGFEVYDLSFRFEKIDKTAGAGIVVKSINGTSLKGHTYSEWNTNLVIPSETYSRAGVAYIIPRPYLYNLAEGLLDPSDVNIKVYDEEDNVLLNDGYSQSLFFVPAESGRNYKIEYSYKARNGKVTKNYLNVACYDVVTARTEYKLSSEIEGDLFGANTQLTLPSAYVESKIFVSGKSEDVSVNVYKDGAIYNGYENLTATRVNSVLLRDAGEYTVTYFSNCPYVTEKYEKHFTVDDNFVAHDSIDLPDVLRIGTKVSIPVIDFYLSGQSSTATSKIISPTGKCYVNGNFVFDELGVYTVEYKAEIDGQSCYAEKKVRIVDTGSTAFDYDPNFNSVSYGSAASTDKITGVHVVTGANNSELVYRKKIDLNKLTRDIPLIEFFGDAASLGVKAFTAINIRLTDAYDPTNVVTVNCVEKTDGSIHGSYIKTGAVGQTMGGLYGGWQTIWGFPGLFDFRGKPELGNLENAILSISFDYAEKRLYSANSYSPWSVEVHDYMIADFDDPNYYLTLWSGFTTGECYLSVSISGIAGTSAEYTIISIAGTSFAGDEHIFVGGDPEITVDIPESGIPVGVVGKAYGLFPCKAIDSYFDQAEVTARVFYSYGRKGQGEIDVIDNCFVPLLAGEYTVEYTATDRFGSVGVKTVKVTVAENAVPITYTLGAGADNTVIGKAVAIKPVLNVGGGSGEVLTEIALTSPSGEKSVLERNSFVPTEEGEYTVTYTFKDYLKDTETVSYGVVVTMSEELVVPEDPDLPKYFVDGIEYALPESFAIDYAAGGTTVGASVYITDKNGRRLLDGYDYTASVETDGGIITVEYVFEAPSGRNMTVTKEVTGVIVKDGNRLLMDKYFVGSGIETERDVGGIILKATENNARADFVKPIYSDTLKLVFAFDIDAFNVDKVTVSVTDAEDENKRVEFAFRYAGALYCSINGGAENVMNSALIENGTKVSFTIGYNKTLFVWEDYLGRIFDSAKTYADGSVFNGFSEYVYCNILFGNITGGDGFDFTVKQINNQALSNLYRDVSAPEMILSPLVTRLSINDTFKTATAKAYDVLGNVASITVSMQYSDGTNWVFVRDKNGKEINGLDATEVYETVLDRFGEYIVIYSATDDSDRTNKIIKNVSLPDNVKPTITVSGGYKKGYSLNETVKISSVTVADNVSAPDKIVKKAYVLSPNGVLSEVTIGGDYKFTMYGNYIIRYFAFDEAGNIALVDYTVNVGVNK